MVLSNKKLKQKLRSLLAHSLSASGSTAHISTATSTPDGVAQELQSLKEALSARRAQRPRPVRKTKKKKSDEETHKKEEEEKEDGDGGKKKRKREEPVVESNKDEDKKKKKRKKKEKLKEKKEKLKEKRRKKKEKRKEGSLVEGGGEKPKEELGAAPPPEREESGDDAKKIYVGGIPYYSTEEDITSFFEGCGTVTEVDCMKFPESGKFRGIAFLTFKTEAAAKRALALDGADMGGFYLKIQPYNPARPATKTDNSDFTPEIIEGYNRIYIGNLSWEITEDELRNFLSGCNVSSIRFGEDKTTGEFKGYAHVDFSDNKSLTAALKLDQNVVCGRPARIRCAVPLKKPGFKSDSGTDETATNSQVESKVPESETEPLKGKKKRRTCYNCGIPGHLSASCPQKKRDDADAAK